MLEHQKKVIENIANNKELFKKELYKSIAWLNSYELTQLRKWVRENFWNSHKELIQEAFYPVYIQN